MATKLKEAAAARLMRQAAGNFGVLPTEPTKYQAIQPDAAAYNVYGPGYAAALGRDTGFEGANILNTRALRVNAEEESKNYIQALAAAQANQENLQKNAGYINLNTDVAHHDLDPSINKTVGTSHVATDTMGMPYLTTDPGVAAVQTSENLNEQHAGTLKDTAGAVKDLGSAGYLLSPDTVGSMITPADQEKPITTQENFTPVKLDNGEVVQMLPDEVNKYINALAEGRKADAAMIAAQAAQYRAQHPSASGSKTVVQYGIDGRPIVTTVTNPGNDPPDSYIPNPKPDAHSGGASGKPSAATLPPLDLGSVKQIGAAYGTVTSTARSKEHNAEVGGVPNSYHIGGHAIDIVRGKGVTHKEIEAAYKNAGYNLIESLDEGDHSHFAFASGPSHNGAPPQRRPVPGGLDRAVRLAQAKGYKYDITANGLVVHLPTGETTTIDAQGNVH